MTRHRVRTMHRSASRSTSAAPSWLQAWSTATGVILAGHRVATPKDGDADRLFQEVAELVRALPQPSGDAWACRGCLRRRQRGPDGTPRAVDLAAEHPCVALLSSPGATRGTAARSLPHPSSSTTTPRPWLSGRHGSEPPRELRTSWPWSCPQGSAVESCSTGACWTAGAGTPATSVTSSSSLRGGPVPAAPGDASRRRLPAQPSKRQPGARLPMHRPRSFSEPVCSSAGPLPRSRRCSICVWPSSAARWRSASGAAFFAAAQQEVDARARIEHARGCVVKPVGLGASGPLVGAAAVGWRGIGRLVAVGEQRS